MKTKQYVFKPLSILCALILVVGLLVPTVSADRPDSSPNVPPSSTKTEEDDKTTKKTTVSGSPSGATPTYDFAVPSGKEIRFQCSAPDGAEVSVTVDGKSYKLKQQSKSGNSGVFAGNFTMPSVQGVQNLGNITYSILNSDKTSSVTSEGELYVVGEDSTLRVQALNASATAFKDPRVRGSGFVTTVKKGAVDGVTSYYKDMYRLASVGWVDASAVQPLESNVALNNNVSSSGFANSEKGEVFVMNGNSHPPYKASHTSDSLTITFARTSGISAVSPSSNSLFSSVNVVNDGGNTTLKFNLKNPNTLWGYHVSYNGGKTSILFRSKPTISGDSDTPLTGLVIGLDAGHGGSDQGAPGFGAGGKGPVEKDINLSTTQALKSELEKQGAQVVMLREGDTKVTLSERNEKAEKYNVDFMISIHSNGAYNSTANGVEVYYYEPIAKSLATRIASNLSSETERANRGAKHSCYVVTLNSFAPSVLVELGYMTNRKEYDSLRSEEGIKAAANAITQSVIEELSN